MLATFGILACLKLHNLSIVTGIADAMKLAFDSILVGYGWLYDALMIVLLFTFVGNMVTWSIGANHSMGATGLDKTAPRVFGHVNQRFRTPDYAFVLFGLVATVITVVNYSLFVNKQSVFWTIFALSSIIFLLPYLAMFPALLGLRRQPDTHRPGCGARWPDGRLAVCRALRGRRRFCDHRLFLAGAGGNSEDDLLGDHRWWHSNLSRGWLVARQEGTENGIPACLRGSHQGLLRLSPVRLRSAGLSSAGRCKVKLHR